MAEITNCKKCGKMFTYSSFGPKLCNQCKNSEEEEFKTIKEYIYNNPGATISEISSVLGVSTAKITRYLKEGRLEIIGSEGDANLILKCEACGKSIKTGRYCDDCERDLAKGLASAGKSIKDSLDNANKENKAPGAGMRFMNKK